jgi:undecaprenyl diphosphate synthase
MDFGDLPPLDLVIRTKGDMAKRTSGFLSRWIGYAELFFSKLQFPTFRVEDMKEALQRFDSIINYRNFGK